MPARLSLISNGLPKPSIERRFAIAWWLWVVIQIGLLAIFAGRVPLSAQFPLPVENSAGVGIAVAQIVMAVLLAPVLAAKWREAVLALAGGAPVLMAGTLLSGSPPTDAMLPILLLAAWLMALVGMGRWSWLQALLSMATLAGPAMWYAASERSPIRLSHGMALLSPSLGSIAISLHLPGSGIAFLPPAAIGLANLLYFGRLQRRFAANRAAPV